MTDKTIHQGRNIKRFREILGLKQEALAIELGEDWTQKKVSLLEDKEVIEPALLQRVSEILNVPTAVLENFDAESAISIIANNFTANDTASMTANNGNQYCDINPVEKWLQAMEENKKLYERLVETEREKVAMMERLLKDK